MSNSVKSAGDRLKIQNRSNTPLQT